MGHDRRTSDRRRRRCARRRYMLHLRSWRRGRCSAKESMKGGARGRGTEGSCQRCRARQLHQRRLGGVLLLLLVVLPRLEGGCGSGERGRGSEDAGWVGCFPSVGSTAGSCWLAGRCQPADWRRFAPWTGWLLWFARSGRSRVWAAGWQLAAGRAGVTAGVGWGRGSGLACHAGGKACSRVLAVQQDGWPQSLDRQTASRCLQMQHHTDQAQRCVDSTLSTEM